MRRRIFKRVPNQSTTRVAAGRGRPLVALWFAALLTVMPLAQTAAAADPTAAPSESPSASPSGSPSVAPSASPIASPSASPSGEATPPPSIDPVPPAKAPQQGDGTVQPQSTPTPTLTWIFNLSSTGTKGVSQNFGIGVTPAPDGGSINVLDNGVLAGSGSVAVDGSVYLPWTPATTGTHHIQAVFSGTASFAGSSSTVYDIEVYNPPPTSVTIEASANPVARLAEVTYTVTVLPNPNGGSIDWKDESNTLVATTPLDVNGQAQYATSYATSGQHGIYANFTGTADWSPRPSDWFHEQVTGDGVTLTLSVPQNPMPAGDLTVTATVTPNPGSGSVRFSVPWLGPQQVAVDADGKAVIDLGTYLVPQAIDVSAEFLGNDVYGAASSDLWVYVWATTPPPPLTTSRTSAVVGELPVVLTSNIADWTAYPTETVTWIDDVGGAVVNLGPVTVNPYNGAASFSTNNLRVGVHTIRARYHPGDNAYAFDADSAPITITVSADTAVHVTFKPSLATVYAYRDGFRDTVSLGGVLDERATVVIKIYSSTGSLKRSWSLGWKNAGSYSAAWNGKTASGVAVAAGKYKVVGTFKDTKGHTRAIAAYTTVSWRKAVWKSATVLKYADAGSYTTAANGALYYSNDYAHGIILDTGDMIRDCVGCAFAAGKFVFTVASTSVLDYRYLYVEVRGHGFSDRDHTGTTSLINPTTQALGAEMGNCMYDEVGTTCGIPTSKSYISSTHRITALVWMTQAWGDAYDLRYLKLTYQYAVWA